jgi:hypothetical protein
VKTAYEVGLDKLEAKEPIPRMTDPLGAYWQQPDRSKILVDATHALMERSTFEELAEYSATNPSGAYEGKMWKRHDGAFDFKFLARGGKPTWMLCWFGMSDKPGYVSNHHRKIILVDGELPA